MDARYYAAVLYKGEEGISVAFPDFLGCISYGQDIQEAAVRSEMALNSHVEWMIQDGDTLPDPTRLDCLGAVIERSEDEVGRFLVKVQIPAKWIRVNLSLAEVLVEQIDDEASRLGMSRSGFLAEAARRMLAAKNNAQLSTENDYSRESFF